MTRGRTANLALVVCDEIDLDHHATGETPTATGIVTAALHRVSAERAALEVLDDTLTTSESLATGTGVLLLVSVSLARTVRPGFGSGPPTQPGVGRRGLVG